MEYTERAKKVLEEAKAIASMYYQYEVSDDMVLYGLYRHNQNMLVGKSMYDAGMSIFTMRKALDSAYEINDAMEPVPENKIIFSEESCALLQVAEEYAKMTNCNEVSSAHLLLALLASDNEIIRDYIESEGVIESEIQKDMVEYIYTCELTRYASSSNNKATSAKATPKIITDNCENLTEQALNGEIDPIIGREKEVNMIINTLSRRTKNNVLIIGPSGAGKTALVKGLTLKIIQGEIPALANKRVFALNLGSLMGGTTYRGQLEEKCANLVKALMEMEDIVLFVDEMHVLMGAGSTNNDNKASVASLLKPALTSRKLQIIGCTTTKEVRVIQEDVAFMRRFNTINLEEPNEADTLEILRGLAYKYEEFHGVTIPDEAIVAAVRLSGRYITERFQPDKSIDVIDEAAAKLKLKNSNKTKEQMLQNELDQLNAKVEYAKDFDSLVDLYEQMKIKKEEIKALVAEELNPTAKPVLTSNDIAIIIEDRTGIPIAKLMASDKSKLLHLEDELHKKIIGQDLAIKAVSDAVRKNSSGIGNPNKPIASFMFAGPTGVGKTELCKALADIQFGSAENIIRIDCSEFSEQIAVSKLIGSAPGYVGYNDGGQLTEAVRHKPYSVVLFDEFEKARGNLTNIMLQILDEGRLTDSNGLTVSFKNCIIVLTTNLGSGLIQESRPIGFGAQEEEQQDKAEYEILKDRTMEAINNNLPPEFINRLSDVIVFTPLNKVEQRQITRLLGKSLDARLEELDIVVKCSDEALDFITDSGYNKEFGARPLARALSTYLEQPLSIFLLQDDILNGDYVRVELEDNELIFYKQVGDELIRIGADECAEVQ